MAAVHRKTQDRSVWAREPQHEWLLGAGLGWAGLGWVASTVVGPCLITQFLPPPTRARGGWGDVTLIQWWYRHIINTAHQHQYQYQYQYPLSLSSPDSSSLHRKLLSIDCNLRLCSGHCTTTLYSGQWHSGDNWGFTDFCILHLVIFWRIPESCYNHSVAIYFY